MADLERRLLDPERTEATTYQEFGLVDGEHKRSGSDGTSWGAASIRSDASGLSTLSSTRRRTRWGLMDAFQAKHTVADRYHDKREADQYSSFDFNLVENAVKRERTEAIDNRTLRHLRDEANRITLLRWMFCFTIAVAMGLTGFVADGIIYYSTDLKYNIIFKHLEEDCRQEHGGDNLACRSAAWGTGLIINVLLVFLAAYICNKVSLPSAGSGIGEIKSYLNGIRYKDWLSFNTYASKLVGVVLGVTAGMPIGKEGPMIHTGAILGAGISQAWNRRLGLDFGFDVFRDDRQKRDFVAAGAAAGLCCAFGAPLGGVLFVLEEGASYLTVNMIWRCLFTATIALFVLQLLETGTFKRDGGKWGDLTSNAMFSFGQFYRPIRDCGSGNGVDFDTCIWAPPEPLWTIKDIPLYMVMAVGGGLLGALWNQAQSMITVWRIKYRTTFRRRVGEAAVIAAVNTTLLYLTAQYVDTCKPVPSLNSTPPWLIDNLRQATCEDGQYSSLATLVFNPLEIAVQDFFHETPGAFDITSCLVFGFITLIMACWTYGGTYPSGIFVPSIAIGAAFGRAFGQAMLATGYQPTNVGVYALMGAGAYLAGVTRVTISLVAIFVESTDETTILVPLTLVLIISKWVSDRFNKGIYDIHIDLKRIPVLPWQPRISMDRYTCAQAMSRPVVALKTRSTVAEIVDVLEKTNHGGFAVVKTTDECPEGKYMGLILRHQLVTLLDNGAWEDDEGFSVTVTEEVFRKAGPQRHRPLSSLHLPNNVMDRTVSLYPYFDSTVFTVTTQTPMTRAFQIIRYLGLRHVPVVDGTQLKGILTRHEVLDTHVEELDESYFPAKP
mmetsp:Transcript_14074/g.41802  ORF Transcript_14074/g.41802 Transcript_14074/m.41802 type:complete len:835 (+) Transcript_14074:217-2721(+)